MFQLLPESVSDEPTTVTAWERDAIKRRPDILFTRSSLPNMGTEISHRSRVLLLKQSTQFQPKVRNHIILLVSSPDLTLSRGLVNQVRFPRLAHTFAT